jgi:hypothetical protein
LVVLWRESKSGLSDIPLCESDRISFPFNFVLLQLSCCETSPLCPVMNTARVCREFVR